MASEVYFELLMEVEKSTAGRHHTYDHVLSLEIEGKRSFNKTAIYHIWREQRRRSDGLKVTRTHIWSGSQHHFLALLALFNDDALRALAAEIELGGGT